MRSEEARHMECNAIARGNTAINSLNSLNSWWGGPGPGGRRAVSIRVVIAYEEESPAQTDLNRGAPTRNVVLISGSKPKDTFITIFRFVFFVTFFGTCAKYASKYPDGSVMCLKIVLNVHLLELSGALS